MALTLNPFSYAVDGGWDVSGFNDQYGQNWRINPSTGGYERVTGYETVNPTGEAPGQQAVWGADDPFSSKWGIQGNVGFDVSPYQSYLQYAQGAAPHFGDPSAAANNELLSQWYSNPASLFDSGYNATSRNSLNPYFTTGLRDQIRGLAQRLGLTTAQADEIALAKAQSDYSAMGQGRSDATALPNLADDLARSLFEKAGRTDYTGLTQQQRNQYGDQAIQFQGRNKEADEDAWKRDDIGGILGLFGEHIQNAWESGTNDGWMPSEQALSGADNPFNTWLQNTVRNEDWKPIGDEYGLATKETSQRAIDQGYETGAAELLNTVARQAIGLGTAGVASGAVGMGLEAAGISSAYAPAVTGAIKGAYGSSAAGGSGSNVLEGALTGAVLAGGGSAAGEALGPTAGSVVDAATQGYKLAKAYEDDNYAALGGLLDGGTARDAFGPGSDFDLTSGPLTNNSGSALDLLPNNKKADAMALGEEDFWSNPDPYQSSEYQFWSNQGAQPDPLQSNDYWNNLGLGSGIGDYYQNATNDPNSAGFWNQLFGTTSDAYGGGSNPSSGGGGVPAGLGSAVGGALGSGTNTDYTRMLGALGAAGLGAYGSQQSADAYKQIANQYQQMGAPYRDKLAQLYADPNAFLNSQEVQAPVQQGTNALARSLSINGNPAGNGAALQSIQNYASNQLFGRLGEEKNRLAGFGGLSQYAGAAPQAQMAGVGAQGGVYGALGYGLGQATNPTTSMNDILMQMARNQSQPSLT